MVRGEGGGVLTRYLEKFKLKFRSVTRLAGSATKMSIFAGSNPNMSDNFFYYYSILPVILLILLINIQCGQLPKNVDLGKHTKKFNKVSILIHLEPLASEMKF